MRAHTHEATVAREERAASSSCAFVLTRFPSPRSSASHLSWLRRRNINQVQGCAGRAATICAPTTRPPVDSGARATVSICILARRPRHKSPRGQPNSSAVSEEHKVSGRRRANNKLPPRHGHCSARSPPLHLIEWPPAPLFAGPLGRASKRVHLAEARTEPAGRGCDCGRSLER